MITKILTVISQKSLIKNVLSNLVSKFLVTLSWCIRMFAI
jgi:hypothetical protein